MRMAKEQWQRELANNPPRIDPEQLKEWQVDDMLKSRWAQGEREEAERQRAWRAPRASELEMPEIDPYWLVELKRQGPTAMGGINNIALKALEKAKPGAEVLKYAKPLSKVVGTAANAAGPLIEAWDGYSDSEGRPAYERFIRTIAGGIKGVDDTVLSAGAAVIPTALGSALTTPVGGAAAGLAASMAFNEFYDDGPVDENIDGAVDWLAGHAVDGARWIDDNYGSDIRDAYNAASNWLKFGSTEPGKPRRPAGFGRRRQAHPHNVGLIQPTRQPQPLSGVPAPGIPIPQARPRDAAEAFQQSLLNDKLRQVSMYQALDDALAT